MYFWKVNFSKARFCTLFHTTLGFAFNTENPLHAVHILQCILIVETLRISKPIMKTTNWFKYTAGDH